MTLRTLWQLCDVSFNLEMKPRVQDQKKYLAELAELLGLIQTGEDRLSGNGVGSELLDVFENLARLVEIGKGLDRALIHSFYYVGTAVRGQVKFYCRNHNINTVNLAKGPLGVRRIAGGVRGDADFKHKSLPYKERL